MRFYEAAPGIHLLEGVTLAEHRAAMAGNYTGDEDYYDNFMSAVPGRVNFRDGRAPTWTTRSGEVIPIPELDTSHLHNIIKFFPRRVDNEDFQALIVEALYRQGEEQ